MNSRERVKRAIKFGSPDRAPISHAALPAARIKYGQALDDILTEYREDFGWDYMGDMAEADYPAFYKDGRNVDSFGTVWQCKWFGILAIPVEWPIADLSRYDEYAWPADFEAGPPEGRLYSGHMCGYDDRWYARGAWITYYEQLQQLRGMENFLMDLATEPPELERLMDDMLDFNLRFIDKWTRLEYDGIHLADDWGEQARLMIRPDKWRRLFKPRYAEMFKRVKDAGMDVWFHSDGFINDIFGDLIEIGVDVINFQIGVVGHDWAARNIKGKVAVRTDIDRQKVMAFGTPAMVKEEVHRTFDAVSGPEGGLIACGEVMQDVPLENVRAMYEAFREYGTYAK